MSEFNGYIAQVTVDGVAYPIERSVTHEHPAEVHEALGTEGSEVALQRLLDHCHVEDWYDDGTGEHMGPDPNGLEMFWIDAKGGLVHQLPDED